MTVTCSNSLLKHVQHHLSYRHGPHLMASFLEAQGGHGKLRGGGNHKSNPLPPKYDPTKPRILENLA